MGIVADQFKNAEWGMRTRELANEIVKDMAAMRRENNFLRAENERLTSERDAAENTVAAREDMVLALREQLARAREVLIVARQTIRILGAGPLDVLAAGLRADAITQINGVLVDKGGE